MSPGPARCGRRAPAAARSRLPLHPAGTDGAGTPVTNQRIEADATNALATGPVTLAVNNGSLNTTRLLVAGGVTLPNNITIQQGNPGSGLGAINYGGAV